MKIGKIEKNEVLFSKGNYGYNFYIVKEGTLNLIDNDETIKTFTRGDSFGELAILHNGLRTATIVAQSKTSLYCLHKREFKRINEIINHRGYEENLKFINTIPFLSKINFN